MKLEPCVPCFSYGRTWPRLTLLCVFQPEEPVRCKNSIQRNFKEKMWAKQPLVDASGRMSIQSIWRLNNHRLIHSGISFLNPCGGSKHRSSIKRNKTWKSCSYFSKFHFATLYDLVSCRIYSSISQNLMTPGMSIYVILIDQVRFFLTHSPIQEYVLPNFPLSKSNTNQQLTEFPFIAVVFQFLFDVPQAGTGIFRFINPFILHPWLPLLLPHKSPIL